MTLTAYQLTNPQKRALRNLPMRWIAAAEAQEKVRTLNALVRAGLAETRGDALSGFEWRKLTARRYLIRPPLQILNREKVA